MYHPTTRVLTVLELLQSHGSMGGPELASRLEVEPRTVRSLYRHASRHGYTDNRNAWAWRSLSFTPRFQITPTDVQQRRGPGQLLLA